MTKKLKKDLRSSGRFGVISAAMCAALFALHASAQTAAEQWPTQTVRIIVGYAAGGDSDVVARVVAEGLTRRLGKPVIVENRPGAGGTIGAAYVARADGDGNTLLLGASADQVNAEFLYAKLPYNTEKDLQPISMVVTGPMMLVSGKSAPFNDVPGMVAYANANPGKVSFASGGAGTASHLAGELLQQTAKVNLVHVPYKGNGAAITDLLGGHVSLMFSSPVSAMGYVKDGGMKPLAVTSSQRLTGSPTTPTFGELGLPGVEASTVLVLVGPASMPKALTERIAAEVKAVIAVPEVANRIRATGAEPLGIGPAETLTMLTKERQRWGAVIRAAKITLD